MRQDEILKKARFKEQNGVKILHIKGKPYEMGFQHGYLLADKIALMINRTLLATAAYVAKQTDSDLKKAQEMLWSGQKKAEPFIPVEFKEEMRGIADGVKAAGVGVTLEQILLWNTNYDQWCIYAHPHWQGDSGENPDTQGLTQPAGGGCSSFCAWDEWAGGDGKLIFGKNEDNFNMPEQLDNRMMVIADPDNGFGHAFLSYPGMIGLDGGLNENGFEMMTQLNSMQYESMAGCGIAIFTRLLLTHASTVDDAIKIFQEHPRCAGIAYHVADAKAKKAAVVETSSRMVSVRYPMPNVKAMWQTNHSNCYPGWTGYSGYNMVADQVLVNELKDISTIEKWQNSLKEPYNFYVQAPSRFERYRQLIYDEYRGKITPENAIKILSDRYDPYTKMTRPADFPSYTNNILCTICAMYPDYTYQAQEPVGTFKAHVANMWSLVAYPGTGDIWLAINNFPAQYGGYEHFNLKDLLGRMR
ncbi:Acyl-coenzyme A:6-aminopenicillanic acid acyl-transferase [uncultured archaeon]|nr:Acyl-coenzyme A:6-aminopenicillanic acid acyl-transferase [uncultured archaeon]